MISYCNAISLTRNVLKHPVSVALLLKYAFATCRRVVEIYQGDYGLDIGCVAIERVSPYNGPELWIKF